MQWLAYRLVRTESVRGSLVARLRTMPSVAVFSWLLQVVVVVGDEGRSSTSPPPDAAAASFWVEGLVFCFHLEDLEL